MNFKSEQNFFFTWNCINLWIQFQWQFVKNYVNFNYYYYFFNSSDVAAWNECVDNSLAQLEHQRTRIGMSLFRNKIFMLDEMIRWNASKFAIFYIYENPKLLFPFFISYYFIFFPNECPGLCRFLGILRILFLKTTNLLFTYTKTQS